MNRYLALVLFFALELCNNVDSRGLSGNGNENDINEIFEAEIGQKGIESTTTNDQIESEADSNITLDSRFSVSTKVELGTPLMVATPFGCALLAQPTDLQNKIENDPLPEVKGEWLSFDFTLNDLSDCTELTDTVLSQLRHELISQYPSTTCKSPINRHSASNEPSKNSIAPTASERDIEFREKLNVTMHPTTLEGVYILRFSLLDEPHPLSESNIIKALSAIKNESDIPAKDEKVENAAPESSKDDLDTSEAASLEVNKEIDLSKKILEELSTFKSESVECMSLPATEKDCKAYSKCDILKLDGKDTCFVSPRTAFWLLDTQCALQSKSALLSVAKDLALAGMLTEENFQTLRSSFDVNQICNTITHTYFANSKRLSSVEPPKAFEL